MTVCAIGSSAEPESPSLEATQCRCRPGLKTPGLDFGPFGWGDCGRGRPPVRSMASNHTPRHRRPPAWSLPNAPRRATPFPLSTVFFGLLAAHRAACRQERTFHRLSGFAVGWLLALGRHTVPRVLAALGLVEVDWSAFYRLFARDRLAYDALCRTLLRQTLALAPADGPYLVAVDGTAIPRRSRTMPGTGWLRAAGTAPFNRGLARCQRFVDLCWLPRPSPDGSSRALPLRWLPAFTPKAVPAAGSPPCPEWAAGLAALGWVRRELDALGRAAQRLVAVADGTDATVELWKRLPAGVVLLARCATNRALFALPTPPGPGQKGRTRRYGAQARHPGGWLAERGGWRRAVLAVRGRTLRPRYRVEGPYRLKRAAAHPVFLLVAKGVDRPGRRGRRVRREPTFWLVSAEATPDGGWALPVPAATLLAWAWRRWEGEVAHREQKTAFGLGDPRCWGRRSTVTSGPFAGWLYGLLVLTGLTVWGLGRPPAAVPTTRWWRGSGRWSPDRLWAARRAELWDLGDFRPVWGGTARNWPEMADRAAAQSNAVRAASHT